MRFLVLGGTGFIGSGLCSTLLKNGHSVRIMDRTIKERELFLNQSKVELFEIDYTKVNNFEPFLKDIDVVYHLISTTVPSTSNQDIEYDITSNICSTIRLLNDVVKSHVKKIIYLSSGGTVYGQTETEEIPEDHPTNPICSYGIHKLAIEKYLYYYNYEHGLDYSIVRLSNPYGRGQNGKNGQGVIPIFISKMLEEEEIHIWGDGLITRDYIYIDDVTSALTLLSEYEGRTKIFNLGSGQGTTLKEIVDVISDILNIIPVIRYLKGRNIDVKRNVLDINRISTELGWQPKTMLDDGIKKMLKAMNIINENQQ